MGQRRGGEIQDGDAMEAGLQEGIHECRCAPTHVEHGVVRSQQHCLINSSDSVGSG